MPDDNRFAGLGEQMDERDDRPTDDAVDEPTGTDAESGDTASPDSEATETAEDRAGGPAFEFEETTAKSLYVRDGTLQLLEDAEFEVESLLRRDHDVRDVTGREFHDAMVRLAADHPEEVVERVLELREE